MTVLKAETKHIAKMVDILEKSFVDIPGLTDWIVRKDQKYRQRLRLWFEMILRQSIQFKHAYYEPQESSVAIWYPPGSLKTSFIQDVLLIPKFLQVVGFRHFREKVIEFDRIIHKRPKEPHFYLALLGTVPCKQGKGVGSNMLNLVLNVCRDRKIPAYLESNDYAYQFYRRHGFEIVNEYILPNSNINIKSMMLNP